MPLLVRKPAFSPFSSLRGCGEAAHWLSRLACLVTISLLPLMVASSPAHAATTTSDEEAFVRDINALRAGKGVAALVVDTRLTDIARNFAAQMAAGNGIYHNPNLVAQAPSTWVKLGENVGVGGDEPSLHQAFVNSPGHYANLVDSAFQSVGVGVVYANARVWVVEDFMQSSSPPVVGTSSGTTKSKAAQHFIDVMSKRAPLTLATRIAVGEQ